MGEADDRPTSSLRSKDPTAGWEVLSIDVAGRPHGFRSLGAGERWVALGRVDGQIIAIEARLLRADEVRLVAIDDLGPYVTGTGALH